MRVDHRAAALVHLACTDAEVVRSAPVRAAAERVCSRLLDRVAGELDPEAGTRWARGDPACARWVRDAAYAVGAPLLVRRAARGELLQGRVEARTDPEGRTGALVVVRTSAPADRADLLAAQVCRRALAGEPLARTAARLRGLGPASDLICSHRFAVGS